MSRLRSRDGALAGRGRLVKLLRAADWSSARARRRGERVTNVAS